MRNTFPLSFDKPPPNETLKRFSAVRRTASQSKPSGISTAVTESEKRPGFVQKSCGPSLPDQWRTQRRTASPSRAWRAKTRSSPSSSISRSDSRRPKNRLVGTVPMKERCLRASIPVQLK